MLKTNFSSLYFAVRKSIISLIVFVGLSLIISEGLLFLLTKRYIATCSVEIAPDSNKNFGVEGILQEIIGGRSDDLETEAEVLQSYKVIHPLILQMDLNYVMKELGKWNKSQEIVLEDGPVAKSSLKTFSNTFEAYVCKISFDKKGQVEVRYYRAGLWSKLARFIGISIGKEIKSNQESYELPNMVFALKEDITPYIGKEFELAFKPDTEILKEIRSYLTVSKLRPNVNVIEIQYIDTIPQRAQEFCNQLVISYKQYCVDKSTEEASNGIEFIDKQLASLKESLQNNQKNIEEYKVEHSFVNLPMECERIVSLVNNTETDLSKINLTEQLLNKNALDLDRTNLEECSLLTQSLGDTNLSFLLKKLQEVNVKLAYVSSDHHPSKDKALKEKEQIQGFIKSLLKSKLGEVQQEKVLLEKRLEDAYHSMSLLPKYQRDFIDLERTYLINEQVYTLLLEKKENLLIMKAANASTARVINPALFPNSPVFPKRFFVMLGAVFLGTLFWSAFIFLRKNLAISISGVEEFYERIDFPVLGLVPTVHQAKSCKGNLTRGFTHFAETFRTIRSAIQFYKFDEKKGKLFVITSSQPEEGKTLISSQIAYAFSAIKGMKVIMIGADLRLPKLHEQLEIESRSGLSNLLSEDLKEEKISDHITSLNEGFDVILSGPNPPNPSELLESKNLEILLDYLKKHYDYIIVDSPPLGVVSDVAAFFNYTDLLIYVVRLGVSTKHAYRILDSIKNQQKSFKVGVVLNSVNKNSFSYSSYEKGYYGYGQYGGNYYQEADSHGKRNIFAYLKKRLFQNQDR